MSVYTRSSANAEGPREALVSRNPALQNISLENPIVWHYLRDSTFSRCDTISEWDRHTQTDGQTHDEGLSSVPPFLHTIQ